MFTFSAQGGYPSGPRLGFEDTPLSRIGVPLPSVHPRRVPWLALLWGCSVGWPPSGPDAAPESTRAGVPSAAAAFAPAGTAPALATATATPLPTAAAAPVPTTSAPATVAAPATAEPLQLASMPEVESAPPSGMTPATPSTPEPAGSSLQSKQPEPALTPELHRFRRAAQEHVLGRESPGGTSALQYAPVRPLAAGEQKRETYPSLGYFVPVEQEISLQHFHEALARLAAGNDADGKVRILAYGASHTQADVYPGYLRAYLQSRFGNGGQGFILLGRVNHWHRLRHTRARHHALAVHHGRYRRNASDEPLGLFGAALVGRRGDAFAEIVTAKDSANTRFELQYFKQPSGGDFSLQLDGRVIARIETRSDTPGVGYHTFDATPGPHIIRAQLHGNGPVRLFGVVTETAAPGVVVDTLGIGGSDMAASLSWSEEVWIEAVRHRNPDLVSFAYGTNETMDSGRSSAVYESQLRAVLTRLRRALPSVSCVLISPFDMPKAARARLLKVLDVQRRASKDFGCGFWDGYAFMGGEGAMRRWVNAKPPLAQHDHIHLTQLGYVYAGIALGDALMRAYDADPGYWLRSATVAPSMTSMSESSPAAF